MDFADTEFSQKKSGWFHHLWIHPFSSVHGQNPAPGDTGNTLALKCGSIHLPKFLCPDELSINSITVSHKGCLGLVVTKATHWNVLTSSQEEKLRVKKTYQKYVYIYTTITDINTFYYIYIYYIYIFISLFIYFSMYNWRISSPNLCYLWDVYPTWPLKPPGTLVLVASVGRCEGGTSRGFLGPVGLDVSGKVSEWLVNGL